MKKYKSKPVEIEAFELQEDFFLPFIKNKEEKFKPKLNPDKSISILDSYIERVSDEMYIVIKKDSHTLFIKTLEGHMRANLGDFIIKGLRGEYYPCKPDVFHKKYELLT